MRFERIDLARRPSILARFQVLLANVAALSAYLTPPPRLDPDASVIPSGITRGELREARDQQWSRSLSRTVVTPGKPIPQELEHIVGILLTTRQVRTPTSAFVLASKRSRSHFLMSSA